MGAQESRDETRLNYGARLARNRRGKELNFFSLIFLLRFTFLICVSGCSAYSLDDNIKERNMNTLLDGSHIQNGGKSRDISILVCISDLYLVDSYVGVFALFSEIY